jgi:hypothetical protein
MLPAQMGRSAHRRGRGARDRTDAVRRCLFWPSVRKFSELAAPRHEGENMKAHRVRLIGAIGTVAALVALGTPGTARADAVTEWNQTASTALMVTAAQDPRLVVLHLAMVHGAMYDAVNAIDGGYEPYLLSTHSARPTDSKKAAAATAAYRVLLNLVPAQEAALTGQYEASLATIPAGKSKRRGIRVGNAAAEAMIAARTDDGRFGASFFPVGSGAGVWRPVSATGGVPVPPAGNDPLAWLGGVKPFLIRRPSQFRSEGPYPLASAEYAAEFNQVKELGSATSATRTADQTHAALYWAENPPRTWNRIFRTLSTQAGLNITENSRFFAMLYLTAADTFISVWNDKMFWSFWRPITAIREAGIGGPADADGNPATVADTSWLPLIANPPYPEHPSGHTGFSGSVVATLQDFFQTDEVLLTDTNLGTPPPSRTRSWSGFSQMIDEIVYARMWSGIHFLNADEQGAEIGQAVASYRQERYFQPVD